MMMHIFPANWLKFWDNWELRFKVLLSLTLQSTLILLGSKRKHSTNIFLRFTLWFAYLSADWLATISLGVLSAKQGQPPKNNSDDFVEPKFVIMSLWAPLLLLHLGGPDTITAYSMEDNELWKRKILTFSIQVGVALYIFLRAWTNTALNILAIPIFISGIVKIGERVWVLRSASSQQFKESLFPDPDPGPNYARYMESYMSASKEGFTVNVERLIQSPSVGDHTHDAAAAEAGNIIPSPETDVFGPQVLNTAHNFLKTFKLLFADLILTFHDVLESRISLQNGEGEQVFEVMEVELGFMYDLFYTKAAVIFSLVGSFLRFVTFSCNVIALCAFYAMEKSPYPKVDLIITHVLLHGAIILELYSVVSILSSDWTMLLLSNMRKNVLTSMMVKAISSLQKVVKNKRWSHSIGQFNLISFCLQSKNQRCCCMFHKISSLKFGINFRKAFKRKVTKCCIVQMIIGACQSFKKFMHDDTAIVTGCVKNTIFDHFKKKIEEVEAKKEVKDEMKVPKEIKKFCKHRGGRALESSKFYKQLGWSVEVEFDQSILLWHIATDLCYSFASGEEDTNDNATNNGQNFREASKLLSDYMMHLLVMRPFMLPSGIGEIRFQDTCAEAKEFFKDRESITNNDKACYMLLKVSKESAKVHPSQVKGDRSKSVLFDACRLATSIKNLREDDEWRTREMWELITQVWVEMLGYGACHCQGIHHAQQLRRGGELLTHVWLLMAHLGMTDQFQISEGHGRTKLIRK